MTDREERLLLTVFEMEVARTRLLEEKWEHTPEKGYEDGPEALAYERAFSSGARLGAEHALSTLRNTING